MHHNLPVLVYWLRCCPTPAAFSLLRSTEPPTLLRGVLTHDGIVPAVLHVALGSPGGIQKECDGFVFGTPVYYAHPSGRILDFLNRAFYSGGSAFAHKPAAAVASARRAGTVASVDVLNKYFTINQMPVVSSRYWNMVHGTTPDEVRRDEEGLAVMRTLGHNMTWLLKSIEAGRAAGLEPPVQEPPARTNFIR